MLLGPTARGSRSYRIPDLAVADLLDHLWTDGEYGRFDAEAGVLLDHPAIRRPEEGLLSFRMRLSQDFGELSLVKESDTANRLSIHAAGPVVELMSALGFQLVRHFATLRYTFTIDGIRAGVAHTDATGWSCELTFGDASPETVSAIERRLGLGPYAPGAIAVRS